MSKYRMIGKHVEWYTWYSGSKLVFIEVEDGQGNRVPWLTDYVYAYTEQNPHRVRSA